MSVGNAYDLTGLTNNDASNTPIGITSNPDTASGKEISISTSQNGGNVSLTSNTTSDSNVATINNLRFWLGASENNATSGNAAYRINDAGTENELHVLQVNNVNTTFSVANGLQMGDNGTGTLMFSYNSATSRSFTLNLLQDDTSSQNYALHGNLQLEEHNAEGATFNGNFGGKGISGNVTLSAGITANINLAQNAGIVGSLTISKGTNTLNFGSGSDSKVTGTTTISGGTNFINPTNHAVFDGSVTIRGGTTTLLTDQGNKSINELLNISVNPITLSGGALAFGFTDKVNNNDKILSLNTSTLNTQLTLSGNGTLAFDGTKTVYFNNGDTNTGDGTLNGNIKFIIDSSVVTANDPSQAILKGNVNGGANFSLKNTDNVEGIDPFTNSSADASSLNTYYIDGNLAISGSFSAFWNDSKGFVGKIATTNGHTLTFNLTSGLSGKNDAWFASGSFVSGKNTITSIRPSGGESHLVFEDDIIFGNSTGANGSPNDAIYTTGNGRIKILSKGSATILGNIVSTNINNMNPNSNNFLILKGSNTTIGTSDKKVAIKIENARTDGYWGRKYSYNTLVLDSSTNSINLSTLYLNGDQGAVNPTPKTFNILSFNVDSATNNVSIDEVKSAHGSNFIGKGIVTHNDGYNTAFFNIDGSNEPSVKNDIATTFMTNAYTAKGNFSFGTLNANGDASNYINADNITSIASMVTWYGNNYVLTNGSPTIGNVNVDYGINKIVINGTSASSIRSLTARHGDNDVSAPTLVIGDNSNGVVNAITSTYGNNKVVTSQEITIKGNILLNNKKSANRANNYLSFSGTSATLGENSKSISIKITDCMGDGYGWHSYGNNSLLFNTTTSTLYVSELSVDGDYGNNNPIPRTFNALSFNNQSDNGNKNIDSIYASYGSNIVGRDLITQSGYNNNLFGSANIPERQSGFFAEFIKDTHSASGNFVFGSSNTSNAIYSTSEGINYINVNGTTTIKGNILSQGGGNSKGHNNILILNGTSNQLGQDNNTISIKVNNEIVGQFRYSNNTLLLGATTNTLNLSELSVVGNFSNSVPMAKVTFNALSFNNATNSGDKNIASVSVVNGANIIGKGLISQDSGYNTNLFDTYNGSPKLKDNFATTFMADTYTANGNFAFGTITANSDGTNYINVKNIAINTKLNANGGNNYIYVGATTNATNRINSTNTISGAISATSRGTNNITFSEANSTNTISGAISVNNGTNTISFSGTNTANTISNNISAGADGTNTISSAGTLSIAGTSPITLTAQWGQNNISTTNGSNINIGNETNKVALNVYGNAATSVIQNSITTTGSIIGHFSSISSYNANHNSSGYHKNTITGGASSTITIGSMSATQHANNINEISVGADSSILVVGNITSNTGKNNFTFTGDSSILTLQGENSRVSSITAFNTAINGNTLYLDATLNDSVVASVDSITNSNVLKVDFKGINADKSTRLNLNTTSIQTLKNVSVTSGTNNTLVLSGTGTMTIAEAVTVGETSGEVSKGVTFDLTSGSNLTFTNKLTTQTKGITSFNLGSSTTITGALSNSGIHNYNIMNAGTTTFKYATGNDGLTFTSGVNNINFQVSGSTLNWQKNDGSGAYSNIDISTSGAGTTTNLNFIESGTFANGISTADGTTNINIYNQKSATISSTIATNSGTTNVVFKAPTQREEQVTYSTLTLGGASNALTSVTSEANTQAKIALSGTNGATIGTTTINKNATLLFDFTGSGNSTVTATNGIAVGEGATLGISLGGSGEKKVLAGTGANITFNKGSTLLVDFQDNNTSNGQLGDGTPFTISKDSKSIINFHGTNTGSLTNTGDGKSIVVDGGDNIVNFMGGKTAVFEGVDLKNGTNTINVYGASDATSGIKGTVITSDVGNVSNIINLNDYATLNLRNAKVDGTDADGSLISTGSNNASELNFIGTGATLQGGFGATSATEGSATITVGSADKAEVSGVITGVVSNSDLKFEAGNSKLTLQGTTNTLKSLTTNATNGVLVLDTTSNNIDTTITAPITIKQNTSLTFGLYSDSSNNYAKVSVGGLKVESGGTLGIAIGGSGTGTREVKITSGSNSYADMFDVGSTLRIDFLQDANGSAKLGNGEPIVISSGRKSQINFYGKSDTNKDQNYTPSLTGGITLDGGSNEVNFYGDATLTGITLTRGNNTIRIKGDDTGITGVVGVSSLGSEVRNFVELEKNATLSLTNGDDVGTLSNASVKVLGTSTKIAGTITNASISFADNTDLTLQAGNSTIKSLASANPQASRTYTRNGRAITQTITNTLTLDDINNMNAISATMLNAITSDNVTLQFGAGEEAKTFTLQANGNTFQGVGFVNDSSNNTLEFNGTNNIITGAINIATNNDLTIKLANTTANSNVSLNLAGGLSNASGGEANIIIEGSQINATLSGGEINANTLTLGANSNTLTFQNQTATFENVKTVSNIRENISGNLIADSSTITINHLYDNNLTLGFAGENASSVAIKENGDNGTSITLAGVELNGVTSDNTLDLTALTDTTISSKVSVGANQALSINLGGTTLNLSEGLDTQGNSTIGVKNDSDATLTGKIVSLSTLSLGNASSTMTLKNSQSTINSVSGDGSLKLNASSNAVLTTIDSISGSNLALSLNGTSDNSATLQLNGASNQISTLGFEASSSNNKVILNGNLTIANKVTDNTGATFDLNSSDLTLSSGMDVTGGTTTFNLSGISAINGDLTLNSGNIDMNLSGNSTFTLANDPTRTNNTEKFNFAFTGSNATLNVDTNKLSLDTLTSSGSNTIDLVINENNRIASNTTFKLLDIASMNGGSVKTILFVNKDTAGISDQTLGGANANSTNSDTYGYAHSDRVVVKAGTNPSNLVLSVVPNLDQLLDLTYSGSNGTGDSGNIALATVKKDSGVQVSSESVTIGFDVVEARLQEVVTDVNGKVNDSGDYLTYFLGGAVSKGASVETQEVAQSALAVSYDLYLANFNSLNKRMGELRDNNHDNGVWARVFGGAISNDFGAGSKTQYVTTQAGYDYSLSVGDNARNYMGIAVAYGHSNTQSNTLTQKGSVFGSTQTIGLDKVSSDMVEVGLYNSYVADSGWYNDTILKFDYIMSEFALSNDLSKMTKTNNFAMILSDEFGYRYSFGVSEKGSWYIDPQAEVGFGWFNQSDFNRSLESSLGTSTLKASQDAILTLRTRVGASLGKKFNTDKGFASLYVGAFYEYDYIEGGNTEVTSANSSSATTNNFLQQIESNGRAILNVGSNIELTKGARLYIDVEKSFGDKQRTFMQFNLGARYSF